VKTLLLSRHALATHSLHGYGDQILSAKILPEGIPPIQRMATFLKEIETEQNVVSPVLRCQQTAQIITKETGKIFLTDSRLGEYKGELPSETFAEFKERCKLFWKDIQESAAETFLICSHGAVIAGLRHFCIEADFSEEQQYDYPSTGELWILRDNKLESFDFN
jgi:broad specificity phosphatase PhoE